MTWKNEPQRHSTAKRGIKTTSIKYKNPQCIAYGKKHKFANEIDFWNSKEIAEFEKEFGKIQTVNEHNDVVTFLNIETDSGEFMVFKSYDDAEELAKSRVLDDLENNPEHFNQDWLQQHLNYDEIESTMNEIYTEWNWGYVNDIEDESDNTFKNRLISELVSMGIIEEKQAKNKKYIKDNIENLKEQMVEKMTENMIDEGRSGLEHYEFNFGKESYNQLLSEHYWWIDYDAATQDAIDTDGVAHFLNYYDGNEHNIGNAYIYQTN